MLQTRLHRDLVGTADAELGGSGDKHIQGATHADGWTSPASTAVAGRLDLYSCSTHTCKRCHTEPLPAKHRAWCDFMLGLTPAGIANVDIGNREEEADLEALAVPLEAMAVFALTSCAMLLRDHLHAGCLCQLRQLASHTSAHGGRQQTLGLRQPKQQNAVVNTLSSNAFG